jgi:hypothetical protein
MIYPPGQGKSGQRLMTLWRNYLEQYADKDGNAESQTIVGAYKSVEILDQFSRIIDRENRYKPLIDQRYSLFEEASKQADSFPDCLLNASFAIYNGLNTLSHQFTDGNASAAALIRKVDEQVRLSVESGRQIDRSAAAVRASFALIGLIAITLDQDQLMTGAIRHVEQRYSSAASAASSNWEHLVNALYRVVETMQILALLTEPDLKDQINQIASRFQEEDREKNPTLKLRNGFCRFFEFGHLVTTQVDSML